MRSFLPFSEGVIDGRPPEVTPSGGVFFCARIFPLNSWARRLRGCLVLDALAGGNAVVEGVLDHSHFGHQIGQLD
jgi:hypothetical protein